MAGRELPTCGAGTSIAQVLYLLRERRDYYTAEVNLWRMISRVFSERELREIGVAIQAFEEALTLLEPQLASEDPESRARAELQQERVSNLLDLARLGKGLLDALLATAKLDAEPLVR
ncbi:MAG: hypothetical protein EOO77_40040, partial [Oxalobacteraceae bacterium]